MVASSKVKVSFLASILDARGLVKLGRFPGEELNLSSWWISLATKISVYGRMDLVSNMATDAKRAMRPNPQHGTHCFRPQFGGSKE